ncbi:GGDEF domain-containing protein [Desulfobotulus mexicanus]|uniref:diguanylate cyclase n=1 Tax=Desulfobotulus mexicanus TaxID=2586642 RepID=A0A5Q4VG34_9BACT|nr:GGDEF domain-containing protein [Desulfobotulus mexicanus]TYT74961.1 diguanylate cyclase [Desulfobotulus mexicanus]
MITEDQGDKLAGASDPLLEEMEQALVSTMEKGFTWLCFPGILEKKYRQKELKRQKLLFPPMGSVALLFFIIYAVADYFMVPDVYQTAWILRFLVALISIPILIAIASSSVQKHVDVLMLVALMSGVCSILILLLISRSPMAAHYHTGLFIFVIFIAISIRFRLALGVCLLILILYTTALPFMPAMPLPAKLNSFLVMGTIILLCLVGCYQIEYRQRRDFLGNQMKKNDALRLQHLNRHLTELSLSDPLTGLANRRHFDESLKLYWRRAERSGDPLAILFMDVDNFKAYNDNYGHPAGDECLKSIARILKAYSRRPFDLSARFGGEEFVMLLPHTGDDEARIIAEKIRSSLEGLAIPHAFSGVAGYLSMSIGVATAIPDETGDEQDLLESADAALYRAKSSGKNCVM